MAAAATEKVFVALPAEFKAGQSTLSWALSHFGGGGGTIVITHVHVPSQMIPVMGSKFHASKVSPEQLTLFRWVEREKVNKMLNDYVHQCSKMKVKCEKLVYEKEDVAAGLIDLIALRGVTKLVMPAAADGKYSRKMDKPKSRTAIEIMQRADPSCKIWFVCKEQLICTRDKEIAQGFPPRLGPSVLPDFAQHSLQLSAHGEEIYPQEEGDFVLELGLYAEIDEACKAAESLMRRALNESSRRQKADEELVSALHKAKEYQEMYLEEVRKREELEEALARANREIAQLRQANNQFKDEQDRTITDELHDDEMAETSSVVERRDVDTNTDFGLGTEGGQRSTATMAQDEYVQIKIGHDNGATELRALLEQSKVDVFSPSSVIQSPYDEDCTPSYFLCPILQEVMTDPLVAADGFTYEAGAIREWLEAGREVSPVTGQPLAHPELAPNFALRGVIQEFVIRRRQNRF
ncbi:hypothetical protein EJB05_23482 [Eragrostis curvula]|uniref:RING-type E3 ubiquitin transferase n=1 Tax=Eragrostis curvula TaxID=38414 RepID=A0A5J9V8I4_9POAL|nr:hypothetical protein EJB05_23482 [Eragrostis curvula]